MGNEAVSQGRNKMLTIMLIILTVITLAGAVALVIMLKSNSGHQGKEPDIDQVLECSVDVPEITTNLASNDFIRISFKIQTDSKKAKEELEKRDFQTKDIIIELLSGMRAEDLKGAAGKEKLAEMLKSRLNEVMQEGKIVKVYITSYIIQQS
ncbi:MULTISPECIES: flagellar basal body-associated protein FliL [Bacillus]|uniref:flagellar basal body-associated protein FliL n=1 Tax=Bacillus TaxID=1386 RepID=UPI00065DDB94|nr:flagellar basal body-associated protein FliL [Bacillus smithii]AKP46872.1 Flagellar biosynthesis protein FliL [Bacillus smithii]MED1419296.1 flagellar basal body-associated protein FliL [Bacillus smithii]MED1456065.1 flagellar basal body-associated protein FliL [Bacillus smithii]MED1488101.1 flagellar basal body-associated protein FliL [Bacillus smithii]MED4882866.1 flagellar basal body-associated protein FliL [Bacillus smithii]